MGAKKVSNVSFMPAVEGISRKWALRRESCVAKTYTRTGGSGDNGIIVPAHTYMGSTQRVRNYIGIGPVQQNVFFMRKPMAKQSLSAAQTQVRSFFSGACAWSAAAFNDLTALSHNRELFVQAKADFTKTISGVSAYGYTSMRNWMSAIAYAIYKDGGTPAANHQLPAFDA